MLNPIQLSFAGARDFIPTVINLTHGDILIGGRNGSGKSTIAMVLMAILSSRSVEPKRLISVHKNFDAAAPWQFEGRILFLNDGVLPDYERYIEVGAEFHGLRSSPLTRVFAIRQGPRPGQWIEEVQYGHGQGERSFSRFKDQLVRMGICPDTFRLYWPQNQTNKFTSVSDEERFQRFASMLGLDEVLTEVRQHQAEHARQERLLEQAGIRSQQAHLALERSTVAYEAKKDRDARLQREAGAIFALHGALHAYALSKEERLKSDIADKEARLQGLIEQKALTEVQLETLTSGRRQVQEECDLLTGEIDRLDQGRTETNAQIQGAREFLQSNQAAYEEVLHFLKVVEGRSLGAIKEEYGRLSEDLVREQAERDSRQQQREQDEQGHAQLAERITVLEAELAKLNDAANQAEGALNLLGVTPEFQAKVVSDWEQRVKDASWRWEQAERATEESGTHLARLGESARILGASYSQRIAPLEGEQESLQGQLVTLAGQLEKCRLETAFLERDLTQHEPLVVLHVREAELRGDLAVAEQAETAARVSLDHCRSRLSTLASKAAAYEELYFSQLRDVRESLARTESRLESLAQQIQHLQEEKQAKHAELLEMGQSEDEFIRDIADCVERLLQLSQEIDFRQIRLQEIIRHLDSLQSGHHLDDDQERSLRLNSECYRTYRFADLFEVDTGDEMADQALEQQLGVLKYAILVHGESVTVDSLHPHVPLLSVSAPDSVVLPKGIRFYDNIPADVQRPAAGWLTNALTSPEVCVQIDGCIVDVTGSRNYPGLQQEIFLNHAARQRKITLLQEEKCSEEARLAEVQKQHAAVASLETELRGKLLTMRTLCTRIKEIDEAVEQLQHTVTDTELLSTSLRIQRDDLHECHAVVRAAHRTLLQYQADIQPVAVSVSLQPFEMIQAEMDERATVAAYRTAVTERAGAQEHRERVQSELSSCESEIAVVKGLHESINASHASTQAAQASYTATEIKLGDVTGQLSRVRSHVELCVGIRKDLENAGFLPGSIQLADLAVYPAESLKSYAERLMADCTKYGELKNQAEKAFNQLEACQRDLTEEQQRLAQCRQLTETVGRKSEVPSRLAAIKHHQALRDQTKKRADELSGKLEDQQKRIEGLEGRVRQLNDWMTQHSALDLSIKEKWERARATEEAATKRANEILERMNQLRQDLGPVREQLGKCDSEIRSLGAETLRLAKDQDGATSQVEEARNRLLTWLERYLRRRITFESLVSHDGQSDPDASLADLKPIAEIAYAERFAGYSRAQTWHAFVTGLKLPSVASPNDDEAFRDHHARARRALSEFVRILGPGSRDIDEEIEEKHFQSVSTLQDAERELREITKARNEALELFSQVKKQLETTIKTHVGSVNRHLKRVMVRFNYSARVEYRLDERPEREDTRSLQLEFSKGANFTFARRIEAGGEEMSGGEQALVSLMLAYAIMKSMSERSGRDGSSSHHSGYLLLDEWDANLDAINAQNVFLVLKDLGRKIISISPRSTSARYETYFEGIAKVISDARKNVSFVPELLNREDRERYFQDAAAWELEESVRKTRAEVAAAVDPTTTSKE